MSFETASLQPLVVNNKVYTKVINFSGESFIVSKKPYEIVRYSCAFYGSSFQHAVNLSRETIGNYFKLPIVLAHDYGSPCILLPILSPKSDLNIWFSFQAIEAFYPTQKGSTIVLPNGDTIDVPVSTNTISRQIAYSNILSTHFLKRMSHLLNHGFITSRHAVRKTLPID
ncbi:competence protein ComK [Psychrobacillus sp. FSL K6-2684]|uniref:competence protein ComK n=1 Tax=unclassified Psychrobacillus TaxID=2636677 RepID=UPI001E35E8CA|nr:competence protein ComK [Psychrobacillus sp. AK 1817]